MTVRDLNMYKHYGNHKYYQIVGISSPSFRTLKENTAYFANALHTELEEDISIYIDSNATLFSNKDEYLVIYKRVGDEAIYARPVDMFFEHVDGQTKRFTPLQI